ncbi:hypothetical protein AC482_00420 [miscellaneous Crenarchaeota group-15 archaeon DG-45]|uniref:Uncharacterized protein n=1 Tax=miscellaneous Crenarchaeota group-15 archaeon DG-45 TaxID=1685127 RepID=A0A0M0BT81_9ARCH|nr:MAG: hypothetical protein AC482_00420 [miscellaneous Crenarchaeota group-15 archaeon DG-45]
MTSKSRSTSPLVVEDRGELLDDALLHEAVDAVLHRRLAHADLLGDGAVGRPGVIYQALDDLYVQYVEGYLVSSDEGFSVLKLFVLFN